MEREKHKHLVHSTNCELLHIVMKMYVIDAHLLGKAQICCHLHILSLRSSIPLIPQGIYGPGNLYLAPFIQQLRLLGTKTWQRSLKQGFSGLPSNGIFFYFLINSQVISSSLSFKTSASAMLVLLTFLDKTSCGGTFKCVMFFSAHRYTENEQESFFLSASNSMFVSTRRRYN